MELLILQLATAERIELPSSVLETEVMPLYHAVTYLVGALRFEQRRSKTRDLQSPPDTVTGLNTHIEAHWDSSLRGRIFNG